jgi:hypothetical protein
MFVESPFAFTRRTQHSIPFLLSSKVYGVLWNNPSLTDFNPADQTVAIDPTTGKGKFTTGAKGIYGFLLSSDNRDHLVVEVNGQHVIDLNNMWLPTSASGFVELEASKEYEVSAKGSPGGVQLAVRPPRTPRHSVPKWAGGRLLLLYGPELNRVISDYRAHWQRHCFQWAYGYWQCRGGITASGNSRYRGRIPEAKNSRRCIGAGLAILGQIRLERHEVRRAVLSATQSHDGSTAFRRPAHADLGMVKIWGRH